MHALVPLLRDARDRASGRPSVAGLPQLPHEHAGPEAIVVHGLQALGRDHGDVLRIVPGELAPRLLALLDEGLLTPVFVDDLLMLPTLLRTVGGLHRAPPPAPLFLVEGGALGARGRRGEHLAIALSPALVEGLGPRQSKVPVRPLVARVISEAAANRPTTRLNHVLVDADLGTTTAPTVPSVRVSTLFVQREIGEMLVGAVVDYLGDAHFVELGHDLCTQSLQGGRELAARKDTQFLPHLVANLLPDGVQRQLLVPRCMLHRIESPQVDGGRSLEWGSNAVADAASDLIL
mmetsp:Transcript_176670/g.566519  ORF Transcript_176670/g.566519 Transcript_176670/m.566519 type:complete len:291 (+) Transcript_176670:1418-2290(+)